jgi:hypothetical protein
MTYRCIFRKDLAAYLLKNHCEIDEIRHRDDIDDIFFIFRDAEKCDNLLKELEK